MTILFRSYKITPRNQNAHAYINAAFLAKLDSNFKVLETPKIVYGGVSGSFSRAGQAESFLNGKSLKDMDVLKNAFKLLDADVVPDNNPKNSSADYRKHLTKALLYKVK